CPSQAIVVRARVAVLGALGAVRALRDRHAAGRVGPGGGGLTDGGQTDLRRRAAGVHRRVAADARRAHVLGAREAVARAGLALTDRHPGTTRGVGPRGVGAALREEALAGVAARVDRCAHTDA